MAQVWLHGGGMHIVPLPRIVGDPLVPAQPTRQQALELVRGLAVDTRASPRAWAALSQRLEGVVLRGALPQPSEHDSA